MARPTKTAQTHPETYALWQNAIAPIIQWCDAEHGRRAKVHEEMLATIHPEKVTRQVFESWISTNPENRTEPMFGNGLALLVTARRLNIIPPIPTL